MLKPKKLLPALIICAAVPLAGAGPAAAHPEHDDGGGGYVECAKPSDVFWYDLVAKNVACKVARRVADEYAKGGEFEFKGWTCKAEQDSDSSPLHVTCKRQKNEKRQKVSFKFTP